MPTYTYRPRECRFITIDQCLNIYSKVVNLALNAVQHKPGLSCQNWFNGIQIGLILKLFNLNKDFKLIFLQIQIGYLLRLEESIHLFINIFWIPAMCSGYRVPVPSCSKSSMVEVIVGLGLLKLGGDGIEFQLNLLQAHYLFLLNLSFFILRMKIIFSLEIVRKLNDVMCIKHMA